MPNDRYPVRDTRQERRDRGMNNLLRAIESGVTYTHEEMRRFEEMYRMDDRWHSLVDAISRIDERRRLGLAPVIVTRNETPRQSFDRIVEEYNRPNQDSFRREYACDFVSPSVEPPTESDTPYQPMTVHHSGLFDPSHEGSLLHRTAITPTVEPPEDLGVVTNEGRDEIHSEIVGTACEDVEEGDSVSIAVGDPLVVGSHSHEESPVTQSPKMRLEALEWQRREPEADHILTLKCRLPETDQLLTGKMTVSDHAFESLRNVMGNWPGNYSIIVARNLEFEILNEDDHEITHLKLDAFGFEDPIIGGIRRIDPTNILADSQVIGVQSVPVPHLVFEVDEPSRIRTIDLFGQVFGIRRPYGESAVAPLRKQKYPAMKCVLCEEHIDEPGNLSQFLGPRQTVKYIEACKQLNQQPQLFCCKCFGIIKSKPQFLGRYTSMMNQYKAFKKAEAEARKVLK